MNEIIIYGVIGILACIMLLLLFCVAVVIIKVIANGIDVEEETKRSIRRGSKVLPIQRKEELHHRGSNRWRKEHHSCRHCQTA